MGSKQKTVERKATALSQLIFELKKKRTVPLLFACIFLLALGAVILIILQILIPAAICLSLIILACIFIIRYYYINLIDRDKKYSEIQGVIEQKEEYLSAFSHRIRTPLNNFSFIIDYLMEKNPEGSQKEMLETLIASTTNMVEAVNDLTMKSAQEISYVPRKDIKFKLFSALSSTVELFEANTDNSITFKLEQSDSLGNNYLGDPITIKQIFLDLFNTVSSSAGNPSFVNVLLKEEGVSRNKELVRVEITTDAAIEGFKINENEDIPEDSMAGKLINGIKGSCKSHISKGQSIFSFTLPLVIAPEEEEESKAAERIKELNISSKEQKELSDANILLVEDNPTNQKIVLITLTSLVKNIDTAETGKEALDHFGKSNYDIILMDIQLPVMDGITVARKIREIEISTSQHTPIIAITANAMIGDKEKCLSAGMDEYLSKPFQPSQLIDVIEKYVTS